MSASQPLPSNVPEKVRQALERMATPLHASFGSVGEGSATAAADARCIEILREHIVSTAEAALTTAKPIGYTTEDELAAPQTGFVAISVPTGTFSVPLFLHPAPGLRAMSSAPKDGTPVVLRFAVEIPRRPDMTEQYGGRWIVGRNRGTDHSEWGLAGPFGAGGWPDDWFEGWRPVDAEPGPISMVLHCPKCGMQHIDREDPEGVYPVGYERWLNPPHKSHLCRKEDGGCGGVWRPADVPTNGVLAPATHGESDTWRAGCHCGACDPIRTELVNGALYSRNMRMIVCATCGNKRCPHATDHRNACTNSNEPGQKGSSWENYPLGEPAKAQP